MTSENREHCWCCNRPLHPARIRWLELNTATGKWTDPEKAPWPPAESQGAFPFGIACAAKVLGEGK